MPYKIGWDIMCRKIFCTLLVFCILFSLYPCVGATTVVSDLYHFETFNEYTEATAIPEVFSFVYNWRKTQVSPFTFADVKHDKVMRLGKNSEPVIPFGKLISDGSVQIHFDFYADFDSANAASTMYIGFYDGRNKDNDPGEDCSSWTTSTSQAVSLKSDGTTSYYRNNNGGMATWQKNQSEVKFSLNAWNRIDISIDFENERSVYWLNGEKIYNPVLPSLFKISPADTNGIMGLFFRVDDIDSDASFLIDNISVSQSLETNVSINIIKKDISLVKNSALIGAVLSEPLTTLITKSNISLKNEDDEEVDFELLEASDDYFYIKSNLNRDAHYTLSLDNIIGKLTQTVHCSSVQIDLLSLPDKYLYYNDFGDYKDDADVADALNSTSVNLQTDSSGNVLKFSSDQLSSGFELDFGVIDNRDIVNFEFLINNSNQAKELDVSLVSKNENGNKVVRPLLNIDEKTSETAGVISLYTDCGTTENSLNKSLRDGWDKLKFVIDKGNKTITLSTRLHTFSPVSFTDEIGGICGLKFNFTEAHETSFVLLDNIIIHSDLADMSAFELSVDESNAHVSGGYIEGGTILSDCIRLDAFSLEDSQYNVNMQKGVLNVDIDFDIQNKTSIRVNQERKNVDINITYVDSGYGWFYIRYFDYQSKEIKTTEYICLTNTGKDIEKTITLYDVACVEKFIGAFDFQIRTTIRTADTVLSSLDTSVSPEPVKIKDITVKCSDSAAPLDINVMTENYGNIFFDDEPAVFSITYFEKSSQDVNIMATYKIKKYRNQDEKICDVVSERMTSYNISADGIQEETLTYIPEQFGLYELEIIITGEGIEQNQRIPFSYCVGNSELNYTNGATAQYTRTYYGDVQSGLELMKKAGLGIVRTGFLWSECETVMGEYSLPEQYEKLLDTAKENDIKVLPIIHGNNTLYGSDNNIFVSKDNIQAFSAFISAILENPKLNDIEMVQIWNEPNAINAVDGLENVDAQKLAEAYADILKSAYTAVKNENPDILVGAFTLAGPRTEHAKKFTDYVLNALDGQKYFDNISMHPYMSQEDPEFGSDGILSDDVNTYLPNVINYYKDLLNGNIAGNTTSQYYDFDYSAPVWVTEIGHSTACNFDVDRFSIDGEYSQAIENIASYNVVKMNDINDMILYYQFADAGHLTNYTGHNFGIVHNYNYKVPYAAKFAYLAVSFLNKLVADASDCQIVIEEPSKLVTKYICDEREVYMLRSTLEAESIEKSSLAINGENIAYFDMLGNQIDESDVLSGTVYSISNEPFYIVVGSNPMSNQDEMLSPVLYAMRENMSLNEDNILKKDVSYDIVLVGNQICDTAELIVAGYKDDGLSEIMDFEHEQVQLNGASCQYIKNLTFSFENSDTIKIFLWSDVTELTPIATCIEKKYST